MTSSAGYEDELSRVAAEKFGWPELRPEQLRAMALLMAGHDVLAVLPTGAGKSAIYQVPALLLAGPTVVVSPLIALQRDQVDGIAGSGAPAAVAVNSALRAAERDQAWRSLRAGEAEYLFLAPEQLAKEDLVAELAGLGVSLFVVDEAHCVSAWGHDFRPDYLRLAPVIARLGRPRVLALTATAAPPVRADIAERLGLREHREVVTSFDRPNLTLSVRRCADEAARRAAVLARAAEPVRGRGLVYTASRKDAEQYAADLAAAGVRAAGYHAGMKAADRDRVQERFTAGELDVVVATSAFGMGIDLPDVRFVLHAAMPESVDSYYQQIGRAGRDDEPAEVVLFHRPQDAALQRFLTSSPPQADTLAEVARAIEDHDGPLPPGEPAELPPARRTRAVNLLAEAGAVNTGADGHVEYADPGLTPEQAVARATATAEARQRLLRSRVRMMSGYAETTGCRRQYLLGYFGEAHDGGCRACDNCLSGVAEPRPAEDPEFPPNSAVRHREWGHGVVVSAEGDRLTVLFDEQGYRTLSLAAVRERNLLSAAD
ncbi:RecQ family ATP-dependent DNA helicase [Crossiella sp. SN42]|uniref:RecQ family ATP-dependent DNA helicase n=1 Tax=Crossiella sp. SN42 TaxID=2944808 RepID=UPI00207C353E|nr:RecQ family ATP-dependent DNA helicase [Crossiella sp. SN42]MCO1577553.1 RecQ family ATP-dependent DNA helicase [Crossiella sp. SN42]